MGLGLIGLGWQFASATADPDADRIAAADSPASSRAKRRLSSATSRLFGGREVKMADGAGEAAANALAGEVKMAGGAKQGHQVAFSSV